MDQVIYEDAVASVIVSFDPADELNDFVLSLYVVILLSIDLYPSFGLLR